MASNFDFLEKYWPELSQIGQLAEFYLYRDSDQCLSELGLLAERIAWEICRYENLEIPETAGGGDSVGRLKHAGLLPKGVDALFDTLQKAGNNGHHADSSSLKQAKGLLFVAFHLCCWFMEVYGDWDFAAPEYRESDQNRDPREQPEIQKCGNPLDTADAIHTAASSHTQEDRAQKAREAAEKLPLTQEEGMQIAQNPVHMDVELLPVIDYALQQNGMNAVRRITLRNDTDEDLENIELQIHSVPAFLHAYVQHMDCLPAHQSVELVSPGVKLDPEFLSAVTERVSGTVEITLRHGGETLAAHTGETAVLPFDYWHGTSCYPELLAAYVMPNHPQIAQIIARATEFLGTWTGDTSMDAYQTQDPNRVLSQAAAIFTAIKEQGIAYVVPPASFEAIGQRVRLCDAVIQQKLGTCLDLTLLYAACLESVGLHPLMITTPNHIFTGVWLQELMFPEPVQDDVSLITKRLASGVNEMAVIETTCVTTGMDVSFDDARMSAEHTLTADIIEYIIDVRRARLSGIRPLPQRIHTEDGWCVQHAVSFREETMGAPTLLDETIDVDTGNPENTMPKKVQWERKLLDMGMRNTLINLRFTKTQLPILTNSLDQLENALADGGDFSIMARPASWQIQELSFEALSQMGRDSLLQAEFQNQRLRSVYSETELAMALKNLYRTAKTAMEENGANLLYLALGMLRWFENPRSTKARYAPIILLPVEMVRKSASQGYVIRLRDEEPQMNITMLEKLKQDFGIVVKGLDPLPADEHGIDIRKVLTIMRKAVMEQPHWDVLEVSTLGIFSFSQFVMWNDIRNRTDDLMHNKIVKSLMDGKLAWEAQPLEIGQRVPEDEVLLPMPADASQLFAIEAACRGNSFVLHGPPGTGKSQTITSLIANALAMGKSVLFVAEKMAALEVVQKRLNKIGIEPFCLELHSNKSRKKDVLEQLRKATEVTKQTTAREFSQKAEMLCQMRRELDAYALKLHTERTCGKSLYALINEYERYQNAPDLEPFDRQFLRQLTGSDLENQELVLNQLITAGREIGHPCNHPLESIGCTQYTSALKNNLAPVTEAYLAEIETITPYAQQLLKAWDMDVVSDAAELNRLAGITAQMTCWYQMPHSWTQTETPELQFAEIESMAQHFLSASQLGTNLFGTFRQDVLTLNGAELLNQYIEVTGKWFLPRIIGRNRLAKQLNLFADTPIQKKELQTYITLLRDYQQELGAGQTLLQTYSPSLESLYKGENTDWNQIQSLAQQAQQSAQVLRDMFGNCDFMGKNCGNEQQKEALLGFEACIPQFQQARNAFQSLLQTEEKAQTDWLPAQADMCRKILAHGDGLKEWITFQNVSRQAESLGLGAVVARYRAGESHDQLMAMYRKAVLHGLICDAIDESDTLSTFSGALFNEKIEQYRRADQQWTELSQQEVYCRLAARIPDFTREAAHSSELGILQRCIKSGGRGMSIRKLFDQIPNLLPRLCPCMLMSPISAAQYLDPKREPFDLVVFDEASQMPTCKAVGVLARGKDAVIVGDPKQMPPTSFFSANTADEDNLEAEDLESILDDCLALNMPQTHLLWHYRSRHESLIAFSNSHFYENKLFTFPSVNDRESKVRLVPVNGVFERGKSRTNRAEAEAVVDELQRRFREDSGHSVGVVTFNSSQQNLIDDLLNEACTKDPELEKWVFQSEEPVFIKNLENVQGDERDVILFSIGYGPDENGKVYMNFGPLNRDGGWRRLNVAVSRARCEMVVFSTLRADQINLMKTKAEGVAALRSFLQYAEGRSGALSETAVQGKHRACDTIAGRICDALHEAGYDTELSVGRSQYKVDIGVVDPRCQDQYLLGIMLDGTGYSKAKTTRDRELAQIGVLSGLGWRILRVWSMDWWDNPQKEIKRILHKIQEIEQGVEPSKPQPAPQPLPEPKVIKSAMKGKSKLPLVQKSADAPLYCAAELKSDSLTAESFTEPGHENMLREKVQQVIRAEAPISAASLIRRVVQSCGIARSGSRIQAHMDALLQNMNLKFTIQDGAVFYWSQDQDPGRYSLYRVSGEDSHHRDVRDVPVQEIANAMYVVLYEQVSMAQEDLLRETARKLGYTRMGSNVMAAFEAGKALAITDGAVEEGVNGCLILTKAGTARAEAVLAAFAAL